ncbi:hypothetical protein, partial [Sphaerisporangium aureirubrum]|uniref:hypothetical protein n=1 Tax=Sphaerisporangium aureirubrum TaxID=1544736 RepID=UPI0036267760
MRTPDPATIGQSPTVTTPPSPIGALKGRPDTLDGHMTTPAPGTAPASSTRATAPPRAAPPPP